MTAHQAKVVIVGGGFGGLEAARALRNAPVEVVVVDRRNHHLFQPLLYQVATAALSPADIASPIRNVLRRQNNAAVVLGEVVDVSVGAREIELLDGTRIGYDYIVLAPGAVDQYFGHSDWAAVAPGLKSIDDATEVRRRFLLAFEVAEREPDPARRRALLTTVVIGAGPTGVEMAGAMAEMARHSLIRDFRRIDTSTARIVLLEGADRVLPASDPGLSRKAEAALQNRGVEVRTNSLVTRMEADAVYIGDERIETRSVVWAAGVAASPLGARLGVPVTRTGRVVVEPDLSIDGHPEVFVVGDLASFALPDGGQLPALAPVAMQQGRTAAANIVRSMRGTPRKAFRYRDRGTMSTIGRGAAVAEIGGLKLSGFVAWLAWLFVHIFFLIGFRNRLIVMIEWAWEYLTWQRGARLITGAIDEQMNPLGEPGERATPEKEDALEVTPDAAARQHARKAGGSR